MPLIDSVKYHGYIQKTEPIGKASCKMWLLELEETLLRPKRLSRTEKEDIYPLLNDTCNKGK